MLTKNAEEKVQVSYAFLSESKFGNFLLSLTAIVKFSKNLQAGLALGLSYLTDYFPPVGSADAWLLDLHNEDIRIGLMSAILSTCSLSCLPMQTYVHFLKAATQLFIGSFCFFCKNFIF